MDRCEIYFEINRFADRWDVGDGGNNFDSKNRLYDS